jgi:hypothetical protein
MVMGHWCEVASMRVIVTGPVGAWRAAMREDIGAARAVVERRAKVKAARDLVNMFERVVGWLVCILWYDMEIMVLQRMGICAE